MEWASLAWHSLVLQLDWASETPSSCGSTVTCLCSSWQACLPSPELYWHTVALSCLRGMEASSNSALEFCDFSHWRLGCPRCEVVVKVSCSPMRRLHHTT